MGETGTYLYAVTRAWAPAPDDAGLAGARLRAVEGAGLTAVVSDVDLAEFGEEGLRRNLEDLRWLETVARTHDEVIHLVASTGPTAPVRMATVFLHDDGVRARLEQWREPLERALDAVTGRQEWSVKAYVTSSDHGQDGDAGGGSRPATAATGGTGAGAAYLQRKREEARRRQETATTTAELGDRIYRELAEVAVASRRLPPQDRRLSGHAGTMVLNAAYLVGEDRAGAFAEAVGQVRAAHPAAQVTLEGPWPAYSFATVDGS